MLSPRSSPRGKLLSQYVRVRITRLDGIDLGLFDFDRHNTLYYFVLNADEQIYLRYGGRDADAPTSRLDLASLRLALEKGLELHRRHLDGELPAAARPPPLYPRQIDGVRDYVLARGRCVECHLVADYLAQDLEREGKLDKLQTLFASPDLRRIGIHLDVSTGLGIERVDGAAKAAGLLPGDVIVAIGGTPVFTFGDLQYRYDKLPRRSDRLQLAVERDGAQRQLEVPLAAEWWAGDLFFRYWTVEPQLYFSSAPLLPEEKRELGLAADGFACRVTFVEPRAAARDLHQLAVGDVLYAVDGEERDPDTTSCELHLKLRHTAGTKSRLEILRRGERLSLPLRSERQHFRKPRAE